MAEDKTYSELSKLAERIKETTEGIEKEAEQMTDAFSSMSTVGEVSSDTLNALNARMREYQNSIMSNAKIMKLSTSQQDKFIQESSNATKSMFALQDQLSAGEKISDNSFAAMQKAMQVVAGSVSSFTGELSKSERDIESRKKEEGAAGGGMLARKLEERQTEYLERLESAFAGDGMMKKSFAALGQKMTDIVPGLSPILQTIKDSIVFQTLKNMAVPYLLRWKQARLQKKMAKAQARFYMRGGDPDNRFFDLRDRILGGLGKLGGPIGDTFKAIREVREKGLGIENWHKMGETPYASEQSKILSKFVQNQNDAKTVDQSRFEEEIRGREEALLRAKKARQEVVDISPEDRGEEWQEYLSIAIQDVATIQKQDRDAQSKIDEIEREKLSLDSTKAIKNALQQAKEEEVLSSKTSFNDLKETQTELFSGSPPYLKTVAELAMERTDLARQQLDATEKSQEPSPAEKKIGGAFGAMKGKLSGMMSGAVGFLKGIVTAIKGVPARIGRVISGIGKGIAGMFKAIGSIDPRALAIGLAAITGLSLNMILLATAVRIAGPALVKIFGGLSKVLGAFASAIRVIGSVVIGIGKVVIDFMTTFVQSIVDLSQIPFWAFTKVALGFVVLGLSMGAFMLAATHAKDELIALGIATASLAAMAEAIGNPKTMGDGLIYLANAMVRVAHAAKGITPEITKNIQDLLNTPTGQLALAQGGGTNQLINLSNANNALTQEQLGIQGNVTIVNTAAVQEGSNSVQIQRSPHDATLTQSTNEVGR